MDTPTPQTPVPTPKPVKHRQLPLLATILSLLVLSIIATLAYQNFILRKQLSSIPPIPPISQAPLEQSPSVSPTNTDKNDWLTYTSKLGYSFQYPKNSNLKFAENVSDTTNTNLVKVESWSDNVKESIITKEKMSDNGFMIQVLNLNPEGKTLEQVIDIRRNFNKSNFALIGCPTTTISGNNTIIIAEQKAIFYTSTKCDITGGSTTTYYVNNGNNVLEIDSFYTNNDQKITTDLILTTFKFLD